jgi:formate/nitrite transporter FocA (FNT family)
LYWDTHRVLVLSLMAGGFLSIGIILALFVRAQMNAMPKLFEASLGELVKDRDHLA